VRILLYSRAFPPALGGIERFADSLAGWLGERGHDVWVATDTPTEAPEPERTFRVARRQPSAWLRRLARAADVVHVNGLALRGTALGVGARRPTVVTHQGHQAVCPTGLCMPTSGVCTAGPTTGPCGTCPERGLVGRVDVMAHRTACRRIASNVAVSQYLNSRLGLPDARTIYSPVTRSAFDAATTAPGEDGLITFAGRLVEEKGVDVLLRALEYLPEARLQVVGDGPMGPRYRDLTRKLGLSLRVTFLGAQPFDGVADAYARAAVVCVPTRCEEAFGFAAAEAMTMGRPLVVAPSGALIELCADHRGFVASSRDPESLAHALRHALGDRDERLARARRAHAFAVRNFEVNTVGRSYEAVYREIVQ
jgi:glycosyltransferase involved in cell wall biosynthesis